MHIETQNDNLNQKPKEEIIMAFKKFNQYLDDKNGMFFTLPNDNDFADVIFLYESIEDVLVADVHYLSTPGFKGYAHCLDSNCPACAYRSARGGRIQKRSTMFIPLYNLTKGRVEFWDRTPNFENVLQQSVFRNYPNPSEYVFRITRHGEARDRNTRYDIVVSGRNGSYPYSQIISDFNLSFPDSYSMICKELSFTEMDNYLKSDAPAQLQDYQYTPVPRGQQTTNASAEVSDPVPDIPDIDIPVYQEPPTDLPEIDTAPSTDNVDLNDSIDEVDF